MDFARIFQIFLNFNFRVAYFVFLYLRKRPVIIIIPATVFVIYELINC